MRPHPHVASHTTIALIRQLRAAGHRGRRVGRIPRPVPPTAIERAYLDAIVAHVNAAARRCVDEVRGEVLHGLVRLRASQGRTDHFVPSANMASLPNLTPTGGESGVPPAGTGSLSVRWDDAASGDAAQASRHASSLIARAAQRFADEFRPHEVHAVTFRFGKRLDVHAKAQLDAQVRAAIGVPLSALERPVRDRLEGWAALNVDLIRTIPARYFDRLRIAVEKAFESGTHPSTLAENLSDDYDISVNDARRIARDQLGKLNADVTRSRHEALGVRRYSWRTMRDGRTRDNHAVLEGQLIDYDDPPMGGGTTALERGHAGTGIECRCYPEPYLQDIIDG